MPRTGKHRFIRSSRDKSNLNKAKAQGPVTAIVTLDWLEALPTVIVTGTALPGWTPGGICTFTCITPATSPGAPPAYCGVTGIPPIVTETGKTG